MTRGESTLYAIDDLLCYVNGELGVLMHEGKPMSDIAAENRNLFMTGSSKFTVPSVLKTTTQTFDLKQCLVNVSEDTHYGDRLIMSYNNNNYILELKRVMPIKFDVYCY